MNGYLNIEKMNGEPLLNQPLIIFGLEIEQEVEENIDNIVVVKSYGMARANIIGNANQLSQIWPNNHDIESYQWKKILISMQNTGFNKSYNNCFLSSVHFEPLTNEGDYFNIDISWRYQSEDILEATHSNETIETFNFYEAIGTLPPNDILGIRTHMASIGENFNQTEEFFESVTIKEEINWLQLGF